MGLAGMIGEMMMRCDVDLAAQAPTALAPIRGDDEAARRALARLITALESGAAAPALRDELRAAASAAKTPVIGITGTGGAGKSSLTDELIRRLRLDQQDALQIAVISIDPSRRKSGGALLGDRIRMNAIAPWSQGARVFMRSLATRDFGSEISAALPDVLAAVKAAGFDLVIVETSGIGQGDAAIVPLVDVPVYVMTPEFGAASQLEKIDMLDFAEFVAINKFDRKGAADALRDVAKQVQRNREAFAQAARRDAGVRHDGEPLQRRRRHLALPGDRAAPGRARAEAVGGNPAQGADAAQHAPGADRSAVALALPRRHRRFRARLQARRARRSRASRARSSSCARARACCSRPIPTRPTPSAPSTPSPTSARRASIRGRAEAPRRLAGAAPRLRPGRIRPRRARARDPHAAPTHTLSGNKVPKVSLPAWECDGEILKWLLLDNVPGSFPYAAGTFAFKRENEDPTRMFAGEGDAFKTNTRFKLLSAGMPAKRLSTAFDSVTLYGNDPAIRPDIYGKVGNSGVSIATLDDMEVLYSGFDLTDPSTSVSMTINGPAPTILAMFINTAIDQKLEAFRAENKREPSADEAAGIAAWVKENVRGTVQADILKEDQGQNTCIFSTEFCSR